MKKVVKIVSVMLVLVLALSFGACSQKGEDNKKAEKTDMNVYVLTGPTGIGAVNMWSASENGEGFENYKFNAVAAPDEVVAKISNGEADIAAIATNLAAKLYKKTDGGIKIIAVNTLGVLNVLDNTGADIKTLSDLKGRKIVTTGQGANPEYIVRYLLRENGLEEGKDFTIEFKAEGTELVSVWATEPDAVIIAPQPVATSVTMKYEGSRIVLDLTNEWRAVNPDSELMMGCVVVRKAFLEEHPSAVENFMKDYEASVKAANEKVADTAALCEKYGIVPKSAIAAKAIPYCNICYVTGETMKTSLTGYFEVLLDADRTSIGGSLPDDGFWYIK